MESTAGGNPEREGSRGGAHATIMRVLEEGSGGRITREEAAEQVLRLAHEASLDEKNVLELVCGSLSRAGERDEVLFLCEVAV